MTCFAALVACALMLLLGAARAQSTDVLCHRGRCPPEQIHLMARPDGVGVSFLWQTFARTNNSTVWLGTASGTYTFKCESTRQNSITQSVTGYNVLFDHLVDCPTLQPETRYYYRVGDVDGGVSDEASFMTGPIGGQRRAGALQSRTAIFGDMGLANSQGTIDLLEAQMQPQGNSTLPGLDQVVHIGDIGYGDDYPDYQYHRVWQQYFTNCGKLMRSIPYMTGPGNHEYGDSSKGDGTDGFATYIMRFALPIKSYAGVTPMFYSFERGNALFVITSTETDYPDAFYDTQFGDQLKWLEKTLSDAQKVRKQRPWIFAFGHRPIYASEKSFVSCDHSRRHCFPQGQAVRVQNAFEQLFEKYNVDIVFNGHVHSYSRTIGVGRNGTLVSAQTHNAPAPWYVVAGGAGNEEGLSREHWHDIPWVGAIYDTGYGAGVLEVRADDAARRHVAHWRFYRADNQRVQDEFELTKDY